MDKNSFNLEKMAIREFIKEYYNEQISEEELEELSVAIADNYDIHSKEDVFEILKNAENAEEKVEETAANEVLEQKPLPEIEEEKTEEPDKTNSNKIEKKPKKSKKKKIIIIISIILTLLIIGILLWLFLKKDPATNEQKNIKTTWKTVLTSAAKDGTLKTTISKKLDDFNINSEEIDLLLMDIDSDQTLELVAYAEDKNNKKIFTYEIQDEIEYAKDYDVTNKNIVYVYNMINENFYWAVNNDTKRTIIALSDKIIEEDDFNNSYYEVITTYKNNRIFDNAVVVTIEEDVNDLSKYIKKVINNKFSNDELLEDNNLTKKKVQELIAKEKQIKEEEEQKVKEEEEKKKEEEAKREEEKKKKETTNKIVDYSGSDIKLELTINKTSQIEEENKDNDYKNYVYVKFANSFLTNNIISSVEYLYATDKYNNANTDNISNNQLRINDVYVNNNNETSVIITFKDKDNQIKKYKLTVKGTIAE